LAVYLRNEGCAIIRENQARIHNATVMISSLRINGYRGFDHFEMPDLGRINLLVGTNNSGKTSILEVVSILESSGDLSRLWNILWRRGERTYRTLPPLSEKDPAPRVVAEADLGHLFHGHEVHSGSRFSITAKNESPERSVEFEIRELSTSERIETQFIEDGDDGPLPRMALQIAGNPPPSVPLVVLSRNVGIPASQLRRPRPSQPQHVQFVSTESSSADEVMAAWNKVSLKPEEKLVAVLGTSNQGWFHGQAKVF
jgi:hypothetical protein